MKANTSISEGGTRMLTSDSKKNIKTIKDLINSNQLVKDHESLNDRVRDTKAVFEAIKFEQKNHVRTKKPIN